MQSLAKPPLAEPHTAWVTELCRFIERCDRVRRLDEQAHLAGLSALHYRAGEKNLEVRFAIGECSLGSILVAATSVGVCAILLGDNPDELVHDLERRFQHAELVFADGDFEKLAGTVVAFVEEPRFGTKLPLDIRGTAFQRRVWEALCDVPAGTTVSYSAVARAIGAPKSGRAVAQACAANPLAVAIPCHRVVRTDGGLSGYRWGVERKQALLARETRS
jgi:AraC family transcriptional regulator of adaptative response/methylated-DNA-[protein]-cysteine methyltransferase